jgi:hypothetical protein
MFLQGFNKQRLCGNYQGIMFIQNGKKNKLFVHSSKERESYYKKYLKSNEKYSNFKRYSVCSKTKPTKHTAFVRFFNYKKFKT